VIGGDGRQTGLDLHAVGVEHRPADEAAEDVGVVVAVERIGRRLEVAGRLARDDIDRSADGIAAVQGALRPAQDLDAIDVVEFRVYGRGLLQIDAVDIVGVVF
jgi:hypothetical protein